MCTLIHKPAPAHAVRPIATVPVLPLYSAQPVASSNYQIACSPNAGAQAVPIGNRRLSIQDFDVVS